PVHLGGAGNHVLDVVGVAGAVDVGVMPFRGRVLHVAGRDRHHLRIVAAPLRLRSLGDFVVRDEFRPTLVGGDLGERRGERGLAVVDMPDGADVDVRFTAIELFFGHVCDPRAACDGADVQNRTGDLVLTKDALCQLSYIGLRAFGASADESAVRVLVKTCERRLERETGIEPATNSLEGCDSTTELLPPTRSLTSLFALFCCRNLPGKPFSSPLLTRRVVAREGLEPS